MVVVAISVSVAGVGAAAVAAVGAAAVARVGVSLALVTDVAAVTAVTEDDAGAAEVPAGPVVGVGVAHFCLIGM